MPVVIDHLVYATPDIDATVDAQEFSYRDAGDRAQVVLNVLSFDAEGDRAKAALDIDRLIEAESRCCPFLRFELDTGGDELVLAVSGPEDARPVIEALFDDQDRMFVVKLDGAGKISFGKLEKPSARCIEIRVFQAIRELFGRSACT